MARPRVFISSTYYDLKIVRADLERFMKERAFDPVLHERGGVPYGQDQKLEEYCYKEIENCDILVSLVGGRYGSQSHDHDYSVSQMELKTAIEQGKQVYIFVERSVLSEHRTFDKNREIKDFKPAAVDDIRIYKFMDEVLALPVNNQVAPFETSLDITSYLQDQWAGLFQRLLQEHSRQKEVMLIEDMKEMTSTLKQLVTFLASEKTRGDAAIRDILLSNHPVFAQLRKVLNVPYRIYFTTRQEFEAWIKTRGFGAIEKKDWDDPEFAEWIQSRAKKILFLKIRESLFGDDGRLKIVTPEEWSENAIQYTVTDDTQEKKEEDKFPF